MKIIPKATGNVVNSRTPAPKSEARERAIAAFLSSNAPPATASIANDVAATMQAAPEQPVLQETQSAPVETAAPSDPAVVPSATRQIDQNSESQPSEVEKPKDPLSSQYAQLARREKAIRAKMQEFKAKEDALRAQEEALKAREVEMQAKFISKDRLTQDPLSVLTESGISYDQITERILNQPKPEETALLNEIKSLKQELQMLKGAQETFEKKSVTQQQEIYKQALGQIKNEVVNLVNTDESFELIKATNSYQDVVDWIETKFNNEGILLPVEQGAREVEEYLAENALKLANLKKIQSKLQPATPPPAPASKPVNAQPATAQPQPLKTLSNTNTAARQLTARERAILAFRGELKE